MKKFLKWAAIALFIALTIAISLPIHSDVNIKGVQTKNYSHALQLGAALDQYTWDHNGRFPMQLSELVPEYVAPDVFKEFLCGVKGSGEKPLPAKLDWLYFGTFFDLNNAPPLLIASPQAFSSGDKMKRVIVRGNCSGAFLNDDEYRQELRKTIEAMHKRAGTPTTPDAVEKAPAH